MAIYNRQKELVEKYKEIERWPQLPLDLNTHEGQTIVKDFLWRVTEELAEAYEYRSGAESGSDEAVRLLEEELSDSLHFIVEIPILLGYPVEFLYKAIGESLFIDPCEAHQSSLLFPDEFAVDLFAVVYQLGLAGNCLKNKRWKQSQVLTDIDKFNEILGRAIRTLIEVIIGAGYDDDDIYLLYYKKSVVNKFRQGTGY